MVTTLHRPHSPAEAIALLAGIPGSRPLAGGTWLLTSQFKDVPFEAVSVDGLLPSLIERIPKEAGAGGSVLVRIGAGATFQDIVDSPASPAFLVTAAGGMSDRNIRNRATAGGNIGANKSCASLIPAFMAAGARYRVLAARAPEPASPATAEATAEASATSVAKAADAGAVAGSTSATSADAAASAVTEFLVSAKDWTLHSPFPLILSIEFDLEDGRYYACRRWSRTACDISVLTTAVSFRLEQGCVRDARIALGGAGPCATRFLSLETQLEGKALPDRKNLEQLFAELSGAPDSGLSFRDDARGSAAFKRYRAACLVADALTLAVPEVLA